MKYDHGIPCPDNTINITGIGLKVSENNGSIYINTAGYDDLIEQIENIAGQYQDRESTKDLYDDLEQILYLIEDFKEEHKSNE